MLRVTIDTKDIDKVLDRIMDSVDKFSDEALMTMGDQLLNASVKEVPHNEGTLQSSGVVEPVKDGVEVGFHTPYAARLHEHPEYRFQKGRKGKYLEDPLKHNLSRWLKVFADEMEALL